MKKFNFKSLLVLVLALILVFSLVACNKDDGGSSTPNKTPKDSFTASDYFGELWKLTSTIGDEQVSDSDYIAISADLGVALNLKNGTTSTGAIDLGLALDAVVNRNPASNLAGSAIKLKAYDPSNSGENWTTIYYFIDDPYYIYFDWAGQNVKVGLDTDDGKADGSHKNSYLGTWINGLFQSEYTKVAVEAEFDEEEEYYTKANDKYTKQTITAFEENVTYYTKNPSVYSLIKTFTDSMGPDWTLNALINGLVKTLGLDLEELLNTKEGIGGTIASALVGMLEESGIQSVEDLFDNTGALKIDTILQSGLLDSFFVASKSADGKTYTATLDESVFSIVDLISGSLPVSNLSSLTSGAEIALTFTKADEKIDKFTISVGLAGDATTATLASKKKVYPEVAISISNLEIKKGTANGITLAKEKSAYKDTFDWNAELELNVDGISIVDMDSDNQETYDLTGKYVLGLDATIDLKNATNNKTQAYAYIAKDGAKVLEASFANETLVVKANDDVKLNYTDNKSTDTKQIAATKLLVDKFGKSLVDALDVVYTPAAKFESDKNYYTLNIVTGKYEAENGLAAFEDGVTYYTKMVEPEVMEGFRKALFLNDGKTYAGNFVGEWDGINIQKSLADLIWSILPEEEEEAAPSVGEKFDLSNVAKAIQVAIPLINATNNKLVLSSSNIGATVISFTRLFSEWNDVSYIIDAITGADEDNVMSNYVIKFAKADGCDFRSKVAAEAVFNAKEVYYTYDETTKVYTVATVTSGTFESLKSTLYVADSDAFFTKLFGSEVSIELNFSEAVGTEFAIDVTVDENISASIALTVSMDEYSASKFVDLTKATGYAESVTFKFDFSDNEVKIPSLSV